MRIIKMPRASGKTTKMIYTAEAIGAIIVCANEHIKRQIMQQATLLRCDIKEPVTASRITKYVRCPHSPILIDDLDLVLASLFGEMPIAATITEK